MLRGCHGSPARPDVTLRARSHDQFTGHDTTSIDFTYARSFRLGGRGSVRYVEGEHVATLRLTFQGHADYMTCHDVAMSVPARSRSSP